jgi:hypothetical protein
MPSGVAHILAFVHLGGGGGLFRPGATSSFNDPLLENTFLSPLHTVHTQP